MVSKLRILVTLIALALVSPMAAAQTPADEAESLVKKGLKLARAKKFKLAVPLFEKAVQLDPQAIYVHNLARALQEAGNVAQAYRRFSEALHIDASYTFAKDARKQLVKLEKKLTKSHARITVTSTPSEGVTISLTTAAGKEVALRAPVERWVKPGKVEIKGRMRGYLDGEASYTVEAGDDKTLKVILKPAAREGFLTVIATVPGAVVFLNGDEIGPAPLRDHVVTADDGHAVLVRAAGYRDFNQMVIVEPDQKSRVVAKLIAIGATQGGGGDDTKEIVGGILTGVGGAVIITGVVLHITASGTAADARNCNLPRCSNAEYNELDSEAKSLEVGAWISYALGAAALVVGVLSLATDYIFPAADEEESTALPSLTPFVAPNEHGASMGAVFRF